MRQLRHATKQFLYIQTILTNLKTEHMHYWDFNIMKKLLRIFKMLFKLKVNNSQIIKFKQFGIKI
jgi:hypothetical protein